MRRDTPKIRILFVIILYRCAENKPFLRFSPSLLKILLARGAPILYNIGRKTVHGKDISAMLFLGKRKKLDFSQSSTQEWKAQWQALVSPECRDVPITVNGKTVTAYVQINHFVMMLQDGLLMEKGFFDVCAHFQRAGYHVIWLMRCTQDIFNGYLKLRKTAGNECLWRWRKPTTNFGRWTSDNRYVTILLQYKSAPDGALDQCTEPILQRVQWAESNDNSKMVPGRTEFSTVGVPGTPAELCGWLHGGFMSSELS